MHRSFLWRYQELWQTVSRCTHCGLKDIRCRYLGGTAAKLLLLSAAVYLLVRLGRRLTEGDKAKASKSGADWPTIRDADLETRFRLKRLEERPSNGHLKVSCCWSCSKVVF